MPRLKLTDVVVRNLPRPEKGQKTHWDASLPGFGVRVSQGGSRSFVVIHGPTRKRHTIGRYGALSLKEARDAAKKLQAGLALGLVEQVSSISFDEAKDLYLEACARKNRPRTVQDYRRHLRRHFPYGRTKLRDLKKPEIQQRLKKLRDKPCEQHHAFVTLKIFLNWALQEDYLDINPIGAMKSPGIHRSRDRVLSDAELKDLLLTAAEHPYPFGPIVKLLLLTGQRRGEIGGLRWEWIDLEEGLITLPAEFTKNRRRHALPISRCAAEIIAGLPKTDEFVFPARVSTGTSFNGWGKCKERLDAEMEGVEPYTLHDLRRTFSSNMARLGAPIHVTEKLLNHVSGTVSGVAAVYNRYSYMDEMREALQRHDEFLTKLIAEE